MKKSQKTGGTPAKKPIKAAKSVKSTQKKPSPALPNNKAATDPSEDKVQAIYRREKKLSPAAKKVMKSLEEKGVGLTPKEKKLLKRAQVAKAIIAAVKQENNVKIEEFNKKIFPRTHGDIKKIETLEDGTRRSVAMDADDSFSFMAGQFKPSYTAEVISKFNQTFIGWQNCAILNQNSFINKACAIPPQDAMSNGYRLSYAKKKKDKGMSSERLAEILRESQDEFQIRDICVRAGTNKRVYGYALAVPTFNVEVDMSVPFDIENVPEGSYTGMTVIEPYWLTYDFDLPSLTDPSSRYFYQPTWYYAGGQNGRKIHRSWCIKLINSQVADILKPTYFFGGLPLTQQIFEAVYAYEKGLNELILLLLTKRTLIMDAEIANFIANPQEVTQKLRAFSELRDNFAIAIKEIGYDIKQIETTLTGLEEIINALIHRVCAIAEMPVPKLFKTALKGFNSTGEYEEKDYKQLLKRFQENDYMPIIKFHNKLYTKSKYGKEIDLMVVFNPTDTPTELEKAKIRESDSLTMVHRLSSMVTTPQEERRRLIEDPNGVFGFLDPDDVPEIEEEDYERIWGVEKSNKGVPEPKERQSSIRGKTKEDAKQEKLKVA